MSTELFLGDTHTCLLTPVRDLTTHLSMDIIRAQLGQPMSFIEVIEKWVRLVANRSRNDSDSCTKAHSNTGDSLQKLRNPEHTAQSVGISTVWRVSFLSDSSLNLFQSV